MRHIAILGAILAIAMLVLGCGGSGHANPTAAAGLHRIDKQVKFEPHGCFIFKGKLPSGWQLGGAISPPSQRAPVGESIGDISTGTSSVLTHMEIFLDSRRATARAEAEFYATGDQNARIFRLYPGSYSYFGTTMDFSGPPLSSPVDGPVVDGFFGPRSGQGVVLRLELNSANKVTQATKDMKAARAVVKSTHLAYSHC